MEQPFFSICIPVWGAKGEGIDYLEHNLTSIKNQTFLDFEVVISDHSIDNSLKDFIELWKLILNIKYIRCEIGRGKIAPNCNNALKHASGKYIKFLYQDDFFYDEQSLEIIAKHIQNNPDRNWLVTGFCDTYDLINVTKAIIPYYHPNIHLGTNTIGCPSVLTIKNDDNKLFLDENLKFLDDVEYYKRYYDKFGLPSILPTFCVGIRVGAVSATSLLNDEIKRKEINLIMNKYGIV
jgi:glycosyltransferase involved in cell wall biosynthesis